MRWSSVVRTVLVASAFMLTTLSTLLFFAQDRLLDSDDFGQVAADALSEPAVNEYLSVEISDALIDQAPNLAVGGSLLADVTGSVLGSDAAGGIMAASVTDAHDAVFNEGADSFVLDVSDLVLSVDQTLQALAPSVAEELPDEMGDVAVRISSGEIFTQTFTIARRLQQLTAVIAVLAAAAMLALVVTGSSPWQGISTLGLTLGATGLFVLALEVTGGLVATSFFEAGRQREAVAAGWQLVFGDLNAWGWSLVVGGAFLAGLAWAVSNLTKTYSIGQRALERLTQRPESRSGELVRLAVLGLVAVWGAVEPLSLASLAIRVVSFAAAIAVVAEVVQLTGLDHRLARVAPQQTDIRSWRSISTHLALSSVTIAALAALAVATLSADAPPSAAADATACNGHESLCDRRLDEVAIVGSHNSMSSTDTEFYLPNQTNTMLEQLDDGVRALLIDTWYARPAPDGLIVTDAAIDLDELDANTRAAVEASQGRSGLGEREVYLCHTVCEVGAVEAVDALRDIGRWLEANPREVLTIVVQDATAPEDTASIFDQADLVDHVHTQSIDEPFPTLAEMIEADRRLFVLVEEDGGSIDWLHPAFDFVQETPFSFSSVEDFSCAANRGDDDSPMFMINHFLTPAFNGNRTINETAVVKPRLEQCRDERGLSPTIVAADFVEYGDLQVVVDELNGISPGG